jgi:nitroreductase
MDKLPNRRPDHPVPDLFLGRWSPRAFLPDAIPPQTLASILEAVRFTPSSVNEQPWTFLLAQTAEHRALFNSLLLPKNQTWAGQAPVLLFVLARRHFTRNGKPNPTALFDAGAAWMTLALAARAFDLHTHAIAGVDFERAYPALGVDPATFELVCAVALGRQAPADSLPEDLRAREQPGPRKPQTAFVHHGPLVTAP